jgi:hypothetical protein
LIDQVEDMVNQTNSNERFLKLVDAITTYTDTIPNAIVVVACLDDYFNKATERLTRSKLDRLKYDPAPISLKSNRTFEEIIALTTRRLAHLYDTAEVDIEPSNELYPFREEHLKPLSGMRTRDVLYHLLEHHKRCLAARTWVEPNRPAKPDVVDPVVLQSELDPLWNDFHSAFQAAVPDEEEALALVLSKAISAVSGELPEGYQVGCTPDGRYLEVDTQLADQSHGRLLVALCERGAQGGGLGKQIAEVEKRLGNFPVALVRTTEFPANPKSVVGKQIAGILKKDGRRVVIQNADWRKMLAFEAFRTKKSKRSDFAAWQKSAKPLSELDSLQKILKLNTIATKPQTMKPVIPPTPPTSTPPPVQPEMKPPVVTVADHQPLLFGKTESLTPTPVTFEPDDFRPHAAFLGGSGSGKTTAALNLIEQLLMRGVPAVLLDRKGDLCRYADPKAWTRKLTDPMRADARQMLRDKLDIAIYTPGEPKGRPLALPIVPPGFDQLSQTDREQFAQYAAAALGSMIGFKSNDADKNQRAILGKAIETLAGLPNVQLTLPMLRQVIDEQDDALLNAIGGSYPEALFKKLAQRLLTLEINNRLLLSGSEQLDVDALLGTGTHAKPGRVRLSVISTRFLGDPAKVDFWVSQMLVAVSRWCAKSPQGRLQALFMFDEADAYLPAGNKQPATKAPMEDLLKRSRSAGVGIFLATQSPGDLDYRCKENVRTWAIGRVREPRAIDKLRPMLAGAKGNVLDKLGGQETGQFQLVRESGVSPVRSDESLIKTEQLSEDEIIALARV